MIETTRGAADFECMIFAIRNGMLYGEIGWTAVKEYHRLSRVASRLVINPVEREFLEGIKALCE